MPSLQGGGSHVSPSSSSVSLLWEQMWLAGSFSRPFVKVKTHLSKVPEDSMASRTKVPGMKINVHSLSTEAQADLVLTTEHVEGPHNSFFLLLRSCN